MRPTKNQIVSHKDDVLVLVDSRDCELGVIDKQSAHLGDGLLHRAISVFLYDKNGNLLIQQRHPTKELWGGYWSNSCCTHPRPGEDAKSAASRRISEELDIVTTLQYRYKFEYSAAFGPNHSERELCSVFTGTTDSDPVINTTEISSWRWISPHELDRMFIDESDQLTPWFKLEWDRLRKLTTT